MAHSRSVATLLLVGAVVAAPLGASAHDELTGTDPADGTQVQAPEDLTLSFSGAISDLGAAVEVTGPDGSVVSEGGPSVDGTTVVQDLAEDLAAGDYAVSWRVTSEDGHPISGEFDFAVTVEAAAEDEPEEPAEPTDEEASGASASTPTEDAATPTTEDSQGVADTPAATTSAAPGGLPVWAWAFVVASVLALGAMLALTWRRGRR